MALRPPASLTPEGGTRPAADFGKVSTGDVLGYGGDSLAYGGDKVGYEDDG